MVGVGAMTMAMAMAMAMTMTMVGVGAMTMARVLCKQTSSEIVFSKPTEAICSDRVVNALCILRKNNRLHHREGHNH